MSTSPSGSISSRTSIASFQTEQPTSSGRSYGHTHRAISPGGSGGQSSTVPRTHPTHFIDLRIPVTDNVYLEGVLRIPDSVMNTTRSTNSNMVAIISHPWSWLGGSMHDVVLNELSKVFLRLDYHVILFNTRGVGNSSGRSSFTGVPESQDLRAVLAWAVEEVANVDTVLLVGYSYGSLITSMIPSPSKTYPSKIKHSAHILVSYPVGPMVSFLTFFNSHKYTLALESLLADPDRDVFLVYGNKDQFFSEKRYQALVARCREARNRAKEQHRTAAGDGDGDGGPVASSSSTSAVPPPRPRPKLHSSETSNQTSHSSTSAIRGAEEDQGGGAGAGGGGGIFKVKMIDRGDHFWRGSGGRKLRETVTKWVEKLHASWVEPPFD